VWIHEDIGEEQTAMELIEEGEGNAMEKRRRGVWLLSGPYFSYVLERPQVHKHSHNKHAIEKESEEEMIGARIAHSVAPSLGTLLTKWGLTEREKAEAARQFHAVFGRIERPDPLGECVIFRTLHSTRPEIEGRPFLRLHCDSDNDSIELERTCPNCGDNVIVHTTADNRVMRWRVWELASSHRSLLFSAASSWQGWI
jgi:ribosomal protein S27AE